MGRLLARDLSGRSQPNVEAPNVASATWASRSQDAVLLTFENPVDAVIAARGVEFELVLDDLTPVIAITPLGSSLLLQLAGPSAAQTITYLGHAGDGPALANAAGVGALTFVGVPIARDDG